MLRTICLNPVIDRIYYVDHFAVGRQFKEVSPRIYNGGKGINVARVIACLGEPCVLYTFAGGTTGQQIVEEMQSLGVKLRVFPLNGETRTTINIIDRASGLETEITEPGAAIASEQEEDLLHVLSEEIASGDIVICSGIPLPGMSVDIYRRIAAICKEAGARCVLDVNSVYLKAAFPAPYAMVKPNYDELLSLCDTDMPFSDENMIRLGKRVMEMGPQSLLISAGAEGGILLCKEQIERARFPRQEGIKSTIGSGDATVAGYCVGMVRGLSARESLRLAMACGICNAKFSRVGYVERDMVDRLLKQIEVTSLL